METRRYKQDDKLVERERHRLKLLLGGRTKYTLAHLGGGDFLVHVAGLDPEMDEIIRDLKAYGITDF